MSKVLRLHVPERTGRPSHETNFSYLHLAPAGAVAPRLMMNLSSSFDHRVVDGHDATRFVQAVRAGLECPALLFAEYADVPTAKS